MDELDSTSVGTLGLTICTIVKVAAAWAIRYVEGPEQNFPTGFFFFLREDVMKVKQAFEKHAAPVMHYSKPGEFITLRHAIKNYLGRDSALAAVISAVVDGTLVPVGYAAGYRGITGHLFRSEELRKYRPVPEVKASPDVFANSREAATVLGVKGNIVRGLVLHGLLGVARGYRNGFAKLVPEEEVRRFAETYVSTSVLAKQSRLNSASLARHLKESGTPLLAIPNPDPKRGYAYFLRKDVAAQIRLPTWRMLREESLRRMKAARQMKWTEYRLAKETAWVDPCDESVRIVAKLNRAPSGLLTELMVGRLPSRWRVKVERLPAVWQVSLQTESGCCKAPSTC